MSETAQPAKRSSGSPKYDDICFSPRRPSTTSNLIEAAKVFHATRAEWMVVDDDSGPILQKLRDLGISLGLAIHPRCPDKTEHVTGAVGFDAKPQYYSRGRQIQINGKMVD